MFITATFGANSVFDFRVIQEITAVFVASHVDVDCTLHANFLLWDISIDSSKDDVVIINVRFKRTTNGESSFSHSDLGASNTTSSKVSKHHPAKLPRFLIIIGSMRSINMKYRYEKDGNPHEHHTKTREHIEEGIDSISQH